MCQLNSLNGKSLLRFIIFDFSLPSPTRQRCQLLSFTNFLISTQALTIKSTFFTPELCLSRGNYSRFRPDKLDKINIKNAIKLLSKSKSYSHIQAAVGRNNTVILEKQKGTESMLKTIKKKKK